MKKLIYTLIGFLFVIALHSGEMALPGEWDFRLDPQVIGEKQGWMRDSGPGHWGRIKISHWEGSGIIYDGYAWYRTTFKLPENAAPGGRVLLRFGAVDEVAKIWLNGQLIGNFAEGWNAAFEVDITPAVRYGVENTLVVRVLDEVNCGGIWRPVTVRYADRVEDSPAVKALKSNGVRAISAGMGNRARVDKFRDAGLNLCLNWSYILQKGVPGPVGNVIEDAELPRLKNIENEAKLAHDGGILTMPLIWVHEDTVAFLKKTGSRPCVDVNGRQCRVAPCPTDEAFWQKVMRPLLMKFAAIQKTAGASGGGAIDFEYYTGEFAGYCYDEVALQGCYCDVCFNGFLELNGVKTPPVPPEQRGQYIAGNFGQETYLRYLEQRVYEQVAEMARAVREVKPDFLFGILPGAGNWFLDGAARGMSAPGLPVLLFNESEYFTGHNAKTARLQAGLQEKGFPALLIGGLTISSFNGEGLGAKAAEMARRVDGYWLYYGEMLMAAKPRIVPKNPGHNEYILREMPDRYWPALKLANQWLDRGGKIETPDHPRYISLLSASEFPDAPKGVTVNADGLSLNLAPKGSIAVENLDFKKPFEQGWRTFYTPPVTGNGEMVFDFAGTKDACWSSVFQPVTVVKGQGYQAEVEVRGENLKQGHLALQVYNSAAAGAIAQQFDHKPDGSWKTLRIRFKAPAGKVYLTLQAHGEDGKISFRNLRLGETADVELDSRPLTVRPAVAVTFDSGDPSLRGAMLNPETGLEYFYLQQGVNILGYLQAIYPEAPLAVRLTVTPPVDQRKIPVKTLNISTK